MLKDFVTLVRDEMRQQQLSQERLAELAGVSQSTLSRILDGTTTRPSSDTVQRIAAALGILPSLPVSEEELTSTSNRYGEHRAMIERWVSHVPFGGGRPLRHLYIDINYTDRDRSGSEAGRISDLLSSPHHILILGMPGAGKSTALRFLADSLNRFDSPSRPPIVVQLRDVDSYGSLANALLAILGLTVRSTSVPRQSVLEYLESSRAVLLLDGLDEVHPDVLPEIISDLEHLLYRANNHRIIVTSRAADYVYDLPNIRTVDLCPLSAEQQLTYAERWLGPRSAEFMNAIQRKDVATIASNPLLLANLCSMYSKTQHIEIEQGIIYRRAIHLLLERWDLQRGISRRSAAVDRVGNRSERLLEAVAFLMGQSQELSLTDNTILRALENFGPPYDFSATDATRIADDLSLHTGLIVEKWAGHYEFIHRSLQEYLAASHILRFNTLPRAILAMPKETAFATAMSSRPAEHLSRVLGLLLNEQHTDPFAFLSRYVQHLSEEERTVSASPSLGVVLLVLGSRLCHLGAAAGEAHSHLLRFFRTDWVRNSLLQAWPYAEAVPTADGWALQLTTFRDLHPALWESLNLSKTSGITVSDQWFQYLGIDPAYPS